MKSNNKIQLNLLDDLIKKSAMQKLDFSDTKYMYDMMEQMENDLKNIFAKTTMNIKQMEGILLLTQARLQYWVS